MDFSIVESIKNVIGDSSVSKPICLHEPYLKDTKALDYVSNCIETAWVSSSGEWVEKFESKLCEFTGAEYAIAVNNGTVALRLALHLCGVQPNDEVIMSPISFVATANAISHLGAIPHFVDVESFSLGISPKALSKLLNEVAEKRSDGVFNKYTGRKISAILPVHVFGLPADIFSIKKIADEWDIQIVEDAAEALGSRHKRKNDFIHCGLSGQIGCLSFNGNKVITTGGGGALITNNKKLAIRARHLSSTAKVKHKWDFYHDEIGWNDRMPNINAALGFAQIEKLENRLKTKRELFIKYQKEFEKFNNIELIFETKNSISNYWLVALRFINEKSELNNKCINSLLRESHAKGILLRPLWRLLHTLPMYSDNPRGNLSIAEFEEKRILNLPSSPQLL